MIVGRSFSTADIAVATPPATDALANPTTNTKTVMGQATSPRNTQGRPEHTPTSSKGSFSSAARTSTTRRRPARQNAGQQENAEITSGDVGVHGQGRWKSVHPNGGGPLTEAAMHVNRHRVEQAKHSQRRQHRTDSERARMLRGRWAKADADRNQTENPAR
jgi:hypothetical protein